MKTLDDKIITRTNHIKKVEGCVNTIKFVPEEYEEVKFYALYSFKFVSDKEGVKYYRLEKKSGFTTSLDQFIYSDNLWELEQRTNGGYICFYSLKSRNKIGNRPLCLSFASYQKHAHGFVNDNGKECFVLQRSVKDLKIYFFLNPVFLNNGCFDGDRITLKSRMKYDHRLIQNMGLLQKALSDV